MEKINFVECECRNWATADARLLFLCGHHPGCVHAPKPLDAAFELIKTLAGAVECAMAGNPLTDPQIYEAYRQAKALEGVFLPLGAE